MLDYGYRSKCCFAAIRSGDKRLKNSDKKVKVWICTKCGARDIDIVPKDSTISQPDNELNKEILSPQQPPKPISPPDNKFIIEIISFGYHNGMVPIVSNLLLDVRCLDGPEKFTHITEKSGQDKDVQDLILTENALTLIGPFFQTILRLIPYYQENNKKLTISIGSNTGQHRSVAVVESLADSLVKRGNPVKTIHRDLKRSKFIP